MNQSNWWNENDEYTIENIGEYFKTFIEDAPLRKRYETDAEFREACNSHVSMHYKVFEKFISLYVTDDTL